MTLFSNERATFGARNDFCNTQISENGIKMHAGCRKADISCARRPGQKATK